MFRMIPRLCLLAALVCRVAAQPIPYGANDWYVIPGATSNGLLKVRDGIIKFFFLDTVRCLLASNLA